MPSILSNKDARNFFLKKGITIDCKLIELTQNETKEPKKYSCAGSLDIGGSDQITARLVLIQPGDQVASTFDQLRKNLEIKSGQIFPRDRNFSLRAIEPNDDEWICTDVTVGEDQHNDHTILDLKCYWIKKQTKARGEKDIVHMLLPSAIEFPSNSLESYDVIRDGIKSGGSRRIGSHGVAAGANIRYRTHEASTECYEFIAEPIEGGLAPNFAGKLIEAIRFVTASSVSFFVCESVHNEIRTFEIAKPRPLNKGLFPEPLLDRPHLAQDFYRLLDCYLRYVLREEPDDDFAFISQAMHPLYGLDGVSLDAIALLVCVTIESIVQHEFDELGKPNPAVLEDLKKIKNAVKELDIAQTVKNRASGFFAGWNESRVTDKLHELRDSRKATNDDIKNWKELRNTSAHGSLHKSGNDQQKLLDRVYRASAFLNKLVFLAIGYKGKYTDYSIWGWPEGQFSIDLQSPDSAELPAASADVPPAATPEPSKNTPAQRIVNFFEDLWGRLLAALLIRLRNLCKSIENKLAD